MIPVESWFKKKDIKKNKKEEKRLLRVEKNIKYSESHPIFQFDNMVPKQEDFPH